MCRDTSGNPSLKSDYNPYDQIILPSHDSVNLLNIRQESRLIFPLNAPQIPIDCLKPATQRFPLNVAMSAPHIANRDCLTAQQIESLKRQRNASNRQLFQDYNRGEIRNSAYPNIDRNMFDNTSKELYKTRDDRNQFMLQTINDESLQPPCQFIKPLTF
jgi:hypothetical protein